MSAHSLVKYSAILAFKQHAFNTFTSKSLNSILSTKFATHANSVNLHGQVEISKVLIVGSGGLSIGQAGEFDYSGSQAIKALKEQKIKTILINPNIATIQTSKDLPDSVYFLPINTAYIEQVIKHEKPDGILLTFGGQSALNVGISLSKLGIFEKYNIKVLGTPIRTLEITEDRDLFSAALKQINIPVAPSKAVSNVSEALDAALDIGYPVIVRSAFALGGLGSGFADNEMELKQLATKSLSLSSQILVEKSMKGWKEIEYEVVRDSSGNCITVCNMENFDPLGIHTGDSIVVAPSQTLSDEEYHMLRSAAIKIISHLGVVGECNVQYALCPTSLEYAVIEVNARLSRSSALASKATGYPLAFVAAKIALGATLPELKNAVTKTTTANFEPSMDYVVTKIPRWDLSKFQYVSREIGSSMKSVGEVMGIGRTWEESLQKAIRMCDPKFEGFQSMPFENVEDALSIPTDIRLFAIGNAMFEKGLTVDQIHDLTKIDKWFLYKLQGIVNMKKILHNSELNPSELRKAKQMGFSDIQIAKCIKISELELRNIRKNYGIIPFTKRIDTLASEYPASTNYLYTTYNASTSDVQYDDHGIIVLGSGVYRIGSSVEFDWCGVSCIRSLRDLSYHTVMINYNPETVSTDFDECDRLYFEELSFERVMDIYELENAEGCIVSVGGQLPQNIALRLHNAGVNILGTSPIMLDKCEDRNKFSRVMDELQIDQPLWKNLTTVEDALNFSDEVGYPVLVRPSYVLSGAAMNVAYDKTDLEQYLSLASHVSPDYPIVISKFIKDSQELDIDAVAQNGKLLVYALCQHAENAGVHSGDATLILPPIMKETDGDQIPGVRPLTQEIVNHAKRITEKVATAFYISGPFNMQLILSYNDNGFGESYSLKVIECNLRASRSFPFVSKVLDFNFVDLATSAIINHCDINEKIPDIDLMSIHRKYKAVKVPVFSWTRLAGADPTLGVEMASTGEVACFGNNVKEAFYDAQISNHNNFKTLPFPKGSGVLITADSFTDSGELIIISKQMASLGYKVLVDTKSTKDLLFKNGCIVNTISASNSDKELVRILQDKRASKKIFEKFNIVLVVSLSKKRPKTQDDLGYLLRRNAVDFGIGLMNDSKTAMLLGASLADVEFQEKSCKSWRKWTERQLGDY